MADKNASRLKQIDRYNHLIEREMGVTVVRPFRQDGYINLVNRYGTSKDINEHYRFMPEPDVPDEVISRFYEGNGLFAKIIDAPAEEAVKHGFELEDVTDSRLVTFYSEALDELDWEETAMTAVKWARLFGGSIAVMLINDGRGLEEPLDWRNIKSIDDIRVFDRSLISPDYQSLYNYEGFDPFRTRGSRLGMPETFQVSSMYGTFVVHESRCLVFQNGILPENTERSEYQVWGVPEYIRIHRAVRDAEIAHGNAPKLLERSVQPVYKMKDLSAELSTEQGENFLLRRLQAIDAARGLMNSIVVDAEGEDYHFEQFSFSGINDVLAASCNMLSAVTNIPQTILFGQPVGGLSSTDDTAMENYYNYVERIQKRMLRSNLRYLLSVIFQAGVRTGEVDEVPKIKVKFNPLWSLSDAEQASLEQQKAQVQQTKAQTAQIYVGMQAIDPTEVRKKLADSEEFDVENMLDEYDDEDLFGEEIPEELSYLSEEDQQKALELYGSYGGAHPPQPQAQGEGGEQPGMDPAAGMIPQMPGVAEAPKNTDPGTEGSASPAAPAATKLPQDMSPEELANLNKAPRMGESEEKDKLPSESENKDSEAFSAISNSGEDKKTIDIASVHDIVSLKDYILQFQSDETMHADFGRKGMKWGQHIFGNESETSKANRKDLMAKLNNGTLSYKMSASRQNRHRKGTPENAKAAAAGSIKSVVTIGDAELKRIVNNHEGSLRVVKKSDGSYREFFRAEKNIGIAVGKSGKGSLTVYGCIFYSRYGWHVVPVLEEEIYG